jgi:hypothetical protein
VLIQSVDAMLRALILILDPTAQVKSAAHTA